MFDKFGQPHGYGQDAPGRDAPTPQGLDAPKREQPLAQAISGGGFGPSQYPADPSMTAWRQGSGQPKPIAPQAASAASSPLSSAIAPQSQGGLGPNLSDPTQWMSLVGNDPGLTNFVTQGLGKNASIPGRVDYYKNVIKNQPGANPNEQAGSADYYNKMLGSDPASGVRASAAPRMSPLMSAIGGSNNMSSIGQPDAQHQYLHTLLQNLQQ